MTELSPAAQSVINAAVEASGGFGRSTPVLHARIAAALRALAYNVYSDEIVTCGGSSYALVIERDDILAIAAELEALPND